MTITLLCLGFILDIFAWLCNITVVIIDIFYYVLDSVYNKKSTHQLIQLIRFYFSLTTPTRPNWILLAKNYPIKPYRNWSVKGYKKKPSNTGKYFY